VCVSHFSCFSVFLATFHFLPCLFLIFHAFQCFSSFFSSYSVCFSFLRFFSFLTIFQVLQYAFFSVSRHIYVLNSPHLISHDFQFSHHILVPTGCISHFPRFWVLPPYSRSYSVFVLFSSFFRFLAIIQVLQCLFLIFQVFQFF
jgi:hypothetical protein